MSLFTVLVFVEFCPLFQYLKELDGVDKAMSELNQKDEKLTQMSKAVNQVSRISNIPHTSSVPCTVKARGF